MGRLEPGVSLYSRKVLIQAKAKGLLPDWLRFVKGVVDSEDIPLNLSREHMQDSSLITKLNSVLTKRILKFLEEESKKDPEAYQKWWAEFGNFLKEGLCTDFKWKAEIGRCLRFESSETESGKQTSLDDYVSRMKEGQREISSATNYFSKILLTTLRFTTCVCQEDNSQSHRHTMKVSRQRDGKCFSCTPALTIL